MKGRHWDGDCFDDNADRKTALLANLGLFGLGTMGSALALNILDKGLCAACRQPVARPDGGISAEAGAEGLLPGATAHDGLVAMAQAMPTPPRSS